MNYPKLEEKQIKKSRRYQNTPLQSPSLFATPSHPSGVCFPILSPSFLSSSLSQYNTPLQSPSLFATPSHPSGVCFPILSPSFLSSSLSQYKCWKTASFQLMQNAGERPFLGVTLIVQLLYHLFAPIAYDTCPNANPIRIQA